MDTVIIDYGAGNLSSIKHKLGKLGIDSLISSSRKDIESANYLIICGVGHFARAMENLQKHNLIEIINDKVINKRIPILGICLGMQLFAKKSNEGEAQGFGWLDAEVELLSFDNPDIKVPHIGWNELDYKKESYLFNNVNKDLRYYFIHSYHFICKHKKNILATSKYGGIDIISVVQKDNICGTQFHPEKSHKKGMKLIENFFKNYNNKININ